MSFWRKSADKDDQRRLNTALALMVGKRLTLFEIDWRVGLHCTDPDAGQALIIETPFTIGPPGDEQLVIPGEYGPSIARIPALLGETVVSVVADPGVNDLRMTFSNGMHLAVVPDERTGFPHTIEWEYHDGSPHSHWLQHD